MSNANLFISFFFWSNPQPELLCLIQIFGRKIASIIEAVKNAKFTRPKHKKITQNQTKKAVKNITFVNLHQHDQVKIC